MSASTVSAPAPLASRIDRPRTLIIEAHSINPAEASPLSDLKSGRQRAKPALRARDRSGGGTQSLNESTESDSAVFAIRRALRCRPCARGLVALVVALLAPMAPTAFAAERVIVALGDSLTAGLGVPADQSYPALLEKRLRAEGYAYRVVNAGVSGDTTAGGLRRVEWALRSHPDIAIVELGANDALRGQDLTAVRGNLDQLVARFQMAGVRVLLAGMRLPPNYGARYGAAFERLYAEVAAKRKAALMPFFLDGVGGDPRLNQADGIHPTAEGYRILVDRLWPHLLPLLRR
jgi:acyl-CoA thioesterase-1